MEIEPLIAEFSREEVSSSELIEHSAKILVAFAGGFLAADREEFLGGLVGIGRKLVAARPAFAPVFHLVTELYARASEPADLVMVRRVLRTAAVEFTQSFAARTGRVAAQAAALLEGGGRVLTPGGSWAVERALLGAAEAGNLAGVVIGEGRPGYEGRALAERLAGAGAHAVKVVTDAALARCVGEVDAVFVGASAVRADGVLACPGVAAITAAAKAAGRPAYALAGVLRILPAEAELPDPFVPGDPARVWDSPPEGVEVEHHRIELAPFKPLKGVVMESSTISPWDAEQRTRSMPVPPWVGPAGGDG
jgi:translation initiation factor 2B subunit (eIF-2B alpha/beta/delta family)